MKHEITGLNRALILHVNRATTNMTYIMGGLIWPITLFKHHGGIQILPIVIFSHRCPKSPTLS